MAANTAATLRSRWMAFAGRAAEIQAHAIFFLLYFVALVPLAFVRRLGRRSAFRAAAPSWTMHTARTDDLASVRRQY